MRGARLVIALSGVSESWPFSWSPVGFCGAGYRICRFHAAIECVPAFFERPGPTLLGYKPLAGIRKIGLSPTANVAIGLNRRGRFTAVQADGGRDREKLVVNSRG